jgi:hypothetical protein
MNKCATKAILNIDCKNVILCCEPTGFWSFIQAVAVLIYGTDEYLVSYKTNDSLTSYRSNVNGKGRALVLI